MSTILVTGASGFVGSHTVPALLAAGHRVTALVRDPDAGERVLARLAATDRERVEIREGDITRPESLRVAMAGADAVVHLAAIPRDFRGGAELRLVNTEGTRAVVAAMRGAGIRRLIHMGAMGVVDDPALRYASSKARAEALVAASDLDWTILKPSLQFGEGDGFFNLIAGLVRMSPGVVPVPGTGAARFQPIHADDVATVVVSALADPTTVGESFELGGPRYWTYREIVGEVLSALGKRRAIVPMPVPLISLVAGAAELVHLPFPVATDQLRQLRLDNIGPLDTVATRFGFTPRPMEGALGYLRTRPADQIAQAGSARSDVGLRMTRRTR
jgi:NADH dehydrogenase